MAKRLKLNAILKAVTVFLCVTVTVLCTMFVDRQILDFKTTLKRSDTADFVRFIDVGQGDSILIHSNGYSALIDTGPTDSRLELSESLHREGITTIDVLILTHLHLDHTGGVDQIFTDFEVKNLILPELSTFSDGIVFAEMAIDKVTRSGGEVYKAVEDLRFTLGEFEVQVVAAYYDIIEDNNRSLIIKAEKQGKSFLFTGDIEIKTEKKLIESEKNIECDVLKVAHHGSNSSTTPDFLNMANPQYAVISVGDKNMYNHPHLTTLKLLEKRGIKTYRTDFRGDITFFVEKGEIAVETEK